MTSIFFGKRADAQETRSAPDAAYLSKKLTEGRVIASECCYGGQLYDSAITDGQAGIAYTYLENKAYGFFGSTTIAYGPSDSNDQADLICQYFMRSVLSG